MKVGLDMDGCAVFVIIESAGSRVISNFDEVGARALADQLIKSAEALETLQAERMKENS